MLGPLWLGSLLDLLAVALMALAVAGFMTAMAPMALVATGVLIFLGLDRRATSRRSSAYGERDCAVVRAASCVASVSGRVAAVTDPVHQEHDAYRAGDQENSADTHVRRLPSSVGLLHTEYVRGE